MSASKLLMVTAGLFLAFCNILPSTDIEPQAPSQDYVQEEEHFVEQEDVFVEEEHEDVLVEEEFEESDEEVFLEEESDLPTEEKKLIVIDAGHQGKGNSSQEPIGPGATTTKAKVASGTSGRFTGIPEYVLTLEVSLLLEAVLLERGYDVVMIRSTHDVDISNSERAIIANDLEADAFVRIHADGNNNATVEGAYTLCPTAYNPYCSFIYEDSRLLSEKFLDGFIAETGAKRRSIQETDSMSGINWCTVPVTIIEMGFMTNEKEDRLMATDDYRNKMAVGMANGLDLYFQALAERDGYELLDVAA